MCLVRLVWVLEVNVEILFFGDSGFVYFFCREGFVWFIGGILLGVEVSSGLLDVCCLRDCGVEEVIGIFYVGMLGNFVVYLFIFYVVIF